MEKKEDQFELEDLSSSSGPKKDDALYVKGKEFQEFELFEDPDTSQTSDSKPIRYYQFLDTEETKLTKNRIWSFFSWMRNFELKNNESAGVKYALISTFLLALVGSSKISLYPHISFINFMYMQCLISFGLCYLSCRYLNIHPFLDDDEKQSSLKFSGFLFLVGGLLYLYSWDFWPRQYSHFVLAVLPFAILIRETVMSRNRFQMKELLFFGLNLIGMYVLLAIPNTVEDFSWTGLWITVFAVILLFFGFLSLKKATGNMVSVLSVYLLILDIFIPAFFAIQEGGKPLFYEVFGMALMGVLTFIAMVFAVRSTQISKSSHILLFASLGLAVVNFGRGVKSDGLTLEGIGGTILSFFGAILILINQSKRTENMDYDKAIPMIG